MTPTVDDDVLEWLQAHDITSLAKLKQRLGFVDLLSDKVSDSPISITEAGDHMVALEVEGCPEQTLAIDYFEGTPPRLHVYDGWVSIDSRPEEPDEPTTLSFDFD
jgi:hypothetical protein